MAAHSLYSLPIRAAFIADPSRPIPASRQNRLAGLVGIFAHKPPQNILLKSKDEKLAWPASEDGIVRLWDAKSGKQLTFIANVMPSPLPSIAEPAAPSPNRRRSVNETIDSRPPISLTCISCGLLLEV